jgi:hypothetical protein
LAVAGLALSAPAEARHHHHYRHHHHHYRHPVPHRTLDRVPTVANGCVSDNNGHIACLGSVKRTSEAPGGRAVRVSGQRHHERGIIGGTRPSGCPHAWCGCGVSLKVFGRIIPELNLAANWRRFPAAIAAAGNVAWRWGHVFYIEAVNGDGTVLAYDPNSGGHVAHVHNRSLRGFRVVNPHGTRYASR